MATNKKYNHRPSMSTDFVELFEYIKQLPYVCKSKSLFEYEIYRSNAFVKLLRIWTKTFFYVKRMTGIQDCGSYIRIRIFFDETDIHIMCVLRISSSNLYAVVVTHLLNRCKSN